MEVNEEEDDENVIDATLDINDRGNKKDQNPLTLGITLS